MQVDVAVVGGGPAGLASAIAVRRTGCTVVVLERMDYAAPRIGEHVAPDAKPLLEGLGFSDTYSRGIHARCPGVRSVWGSDEPADRDYLFHPHGEGLNLSRPAFDADLAGFARRLEVVILTRTTVTALSRFAGQWSVTINRQGTPMKVSCRVVVDATGRNASVARRLGARPIVYDELVGLIGTGLERVQQTNMVLIEALPEGWWYSVGLADGSVIATFMTDASALGSSKVGRLQCWRTCLGKARMTAARLFFPDSSFDLRVRVARTQRLDKIVGEGWLAVGDAAMSFDPLSSEGISKGLESGRKAASVAAALCRGDISAARTYQHDLGETFANYLMMRYRYYGVENRWPNAPFWQHRRLPPKPVNTVNDSSL
jgi:flavin-dependent dehydrogenase